VQAPDETSGLTAVLGSVMRDREIDLIIRLASADLLGFLGSAAAFRASVTELLKSFRGSDMDLQSTRALERMGIDFDPQSTL
jgi:hypothetical protein